MGKIGFLFAGQGAQHPGMGQALYASSPAAKALFEAAEALRPGTMEQCFTGSMETLTDTRNAQPCLFTVDLCCAAALTEHGVQADMAAGFSLGELAGIAYCDMLPFDEAFRLVEYRAESMHQCALAHPGGMAAVLRLDAETVERLCGQFQQVYPVNYNSDQQTVVAGIAEELTAFAAAVTEAGGKYMPLAVGGGFHSPFMQQASEQLAAYVLPLQFNASRVPLYANATAQPYKNDATMLLYRQVKSPVLWKQTIEAMLDAGCNTFIELGPGKTLTNLLKKNTRVKLALHVSDTESLEQALASLNV